MTRFLFVVPPLVGHVNPTISVAGELRAHGHEVAWVGYREVVAARLPEGASFFGLETKVSREDLAKLGEKAISLRSFAALEFLWGEIIPRLARDMIPGVREAVRVYQPSVMVVDGQALAGALIARASGLPWATFATTSADRRECLGGFPKVLDWTEDRLKELQTETGFEPAFEPESSPHMTIVLSTEALVGPTDRFPSTYHFVGPALSRRESNVSFPWEKLHNGPRVLITLGTVNAKRGKKFFNAITEGLRELPIQAVLVAPESFGPFPANFLVQRYVPQLELLSHVNAVVCHGGHNTVCEALAHGLPIVVAPIKDDQPVVAEQVARAGAGVRVSFLRSRAGSLRTAVLRVLDESHFRQAAEKVQKSFQQAGGAARAAELLETLVNEDSRNTIDAT